VRLDRLWGPVGEGVMDLFLQAAILVPYLKQYYILFIYLRNTLYPRANGSGIYLGRYTGVIRDYSLYRRLLIRTYTQYFGIEVLRDI
jgi:hypothetical protein